MMTPLQTFNLELFADYHQIYLQDQGTEADPSAVWTDEAVEGLLGLAQGLVAVGTYRNMTVPFSVKLFDADPGPLVDRQDEIDLINECDLSVRSGIIIVMGCTEYYPDALRIEVTPRLYRVRIYYANGHTMSWNGLEGDDFYETHLWPSLAERGKTVVLDRRKPPAHWVQEE